MEFWDILNVNGNPIGKRLMKNSPLQEGEYHLAVEIWIVNHRGEILIQKRSERCELLPGIWGLTTGRVVSGESSLDGCLREVREELGLRLKAEQPQLLRRILRTELHLIWDLYLVRQEVALSELSLQPDEVSDVAWVSPNQLRTMAQEKRVFCYPEFYEMIDLVESQL